MKKANFNKAKQKLDWQLKAGIITESQYEIRSMLLEEEEILGNTGVTKLSQVKKDLAKAAVYNSAGKKDGNDKDDVVPGKKKPIPVKDLRASQTEIKRDKACSMAINFLLKGDYNNADLGAIVSGDSPAYIMDGHHRWAATYLIDPKATLQVTQIDLPGQALVSALNVVTVGGLGKTQGNKGVGSVEEFTGDKIAEQMNIYLKEGIPGDEKNNVKPVTPEQVKEALGKMPGANGDSNKGLEIMKGNADGLPKQIMPGAPARVEMPVIDPKVVGAVQSLLAKGAIDIKPPYSDKVKANLDVKESTGNIVHTLIQEAIKKQKRIY